jgi:hypothetical protein
MASTAQIRKNRWTDTARRRRNFLFDGFGPGAVYPGTAKFIADFKAKFGSDPQPFAAQAYDSAGLARYRDSRQGQEWRDAHRADANAIRGLQIGASKHMPSTRSIRSSPSLSSGALDPAMRTDDQTPNAPPAHNLFV